MFVRYVRPSVCLFAHSLARSFIHSFIHSFHSTDLTCICTSKFIYYPISQSIYWRESEASETPSIATYRKKCCVYSTYVITTMRMLTILREAEEWTRMHLREACLLFASAITKSSLYVRQSACTSNNFTFARPLMGTIF